MLKLVPFGCGVVLLVAREEKELKRLCEEPMLVKLEQSRKFLRVTLCTRKSALGIRLIVSNTTLGTIKLRSHAGNKRKRGNANEIVEA